MTITLTKPVRVGGVELAAATTQTFSEDVEADLIARGAAKPVFLAPGAVAPGANHIAEHRELGGVANQIASIGTPFVIPPGDNASTGLLFSGTAGAFSLSAAILSNIWTALRGCWCYFPANFGGSSYPGGWYWTVFSSDTAGIVYTNTYTSGIPSGPETPTPFPVNLSGRINQTTSEITGPAGIIIPGGSIGKNGTIKTHWRIGGNVTGTKYYRTYLDAVGVGLLSSTTSPMYEALTSICNQGNESRQLLSHTNSLPGAGTGFATINANGMTSIDTSVDKTLSIGLQLSVNTAAAILLHADVSVTYGE